MWKCKHCNSEFDFEYGRSGASKKRNHLRWCDTNPKRKEYLSNLNLAREAARQPIANEKRNNSIKKNWIDGKYDHVDFSKSFKNKKHSNETKKKLSESRIKYLIENPDKHPWKNNDKFRSIPCEILKDILRKNGFKFKEEWNPIPNRFYSTDIAFPLYKICIEVNGEQHYNRSGSLKKYYRDRHNLIKNNGWEIIEIHYLKVYDIKYIDKLIKRLRSSVD